MHWGAKRGQNSSDFIFKRTIYVKEISSMLTQINFIILNEWMFETLTITWYIIFRSAAVRNFTLRAAVLFCCCGRHFVDIKRQEQQEKVASSPSLKHVFFGQKSSEEATDLTRLSSFVPSKSWDPSLLKSIVNKALAQN